MSEKSQLEKLAEDYERQARALRRQVMGPVEQAQLEALRHCREALKKPLAFYFHAQDVAKLGVNLVDLEANHWIERLPRPLPHQLFYSEMCQIQMVYADGSPFGKAFTLPERRSLELRNEDLRAAWRDGTAYKITAWGELSLACGYMVHGLSIGEWRNGLDGQEAAWRIAQNEKREAGNESTKLN